MTSSDSRTWRTLWRMHFFAGILSFPVLGLLALSGLAILYTGPIHQLEYGEMLTVTPVKDPISLEAQKTVAQNTFAGFVVAGVTPPGSTRASTMFSMKPAKGGGPVKQVFVHPGDGRVLGSRNQGSGIVGLANRVHGNLNNAAVTVPLPSLSGLIGGDGGLIKRVALGSLLVEIFAGWALVLAASGIYLWWPRKAGQSRNTIVPRIKKKGRARWRDLHAIPGLTLSLILGFFVVTGMPWSGYWGDGWRHLSSKITPRPAIEQPNSAVVRTGDLDRFGNKIPWVLQDTPVPASKTPNTAQPWGTSTDVGPNGSTTPRSKPLRTPLSMSSSPGTPSVSSTPEVPAGHNDDVSHQHVVTSGGTGSASALTLDAIAEVARKEGLIPGFSIAMPVDTPGTTTTEAVYGSFTASDPWPGRIQHEKTAYIDQFSGKTLAISTPGDWGQGALGSATEFGVQTHMGTQFGLLSRTIMTIGCLGVLWSITSALTMFLKRRRPGTAGIPRRPADIRTARKLLLIFAGLGIVYPLWGATAALVMGLDRFVIRRNRWLRFAFGQR
jgi:uncharacterized iron-regulated membrane protein